MVSSDFAVNSNCQAGMWRQSKGISIDLNYCILGFMFRVAKPLP